MPALPGWLPSRQAAESWAKGARDGNPQGGSPCGDGMGFPLQHSGIADPVLEMLTGVAAHTVCLGQLGMEMGKVATWCWHGINGYPAAKDGLRLVTL